MYISYFALAAFYAAIAVVNAIATPNPDYSSSKTPKAAQWTGRHHKASSERYNNYNATHGGPRCKPEHVVYRREWFVLLVLRMLKANLLLTRRRRTLSIAERKRYIDAVQCLRHRIPSLHKGIIAGASSRYDDFQIVHINQTFTIHFNVSLSLVLFFFPFSLSRSITGLLSMIRPCLWDGIGGLLGRTNRLYGMNVGIGELNRGYHSMLAYCPQPDSI